MDPASMNPEQLTSTPTKHHILNEEIQKLAMKTHLEVQQREDIRRDLAERMKFVPPDLRVGESVFYWQDDPNKIQQGWKSGKWLKVEILAVKGPIGCYQFWCVHFSNKCRLTKKTSGHCGFGTSSRLAWANKSTCAAAFLCERGICGHRAMLILTWDRPAGCYAR